MTSNSSSPSSSAPARCRRPRTETATVASTNRATARDIDPPLTSSGHLSTPGRSRRTSRQIATDQRQPYAHWHNSCRAVCCGREKTRGKPLSHGHSDVRGAPHGLRNVGHPPVFEVEEGMHSNQLFNTPGAHACRDACACPRRRRRLVCGQRRGDHHDGRPARRRDQEGREGRADALDRLLGLRLQDQVGEDRQHRERPAVPGRDVRRPPADRARSRGTGRRKRPCRSPTPACRSRRSRRCSRSSGPSSPGSTRASTLATA